jgi:hypothetical protein
MKTPFLKWGFCGAAGALLLLPLAASATLVNNGSFENLNNSYVDNGSGYMLIANGDNSTIPDWTVADLNIAWIKSGGKSGLVGTDGGYFLDLSGIVNTSPFGGVIGTTISTVAGHTYDLSFDVGRGNGEDGQPVVVLATAGAQSQTFTVNTTDPGAGKIVWQTFHLQFLATDSSTTIKINGTSADNGNGFIGLDNVSASAVPEASTVIAGLLLLLPFGASTIRILRKKQ